LESFICFRTEKEIRDRKVIYGDDSEFFIMFRNGSNSLCLDDKVDRETRALISLRRPRKAAPLDEGSTKNWRLWAALFDRVFYAECQVVLQDPFCKLFDVCRVLLRFWLYFAL